MMIRLWHGTGTLTAILLLATAANADSWELRPAADDAPGSAEIEAGNIDEAIRILTAESRSAAAPTSLAVLQNLCVAHAMNREYDTATRYCDRAVAHKEADASAFNNRGVVRAVTGDYLGAARDLQRAKYLAGQCDPACDGIGNVVQQNLERVLDRTDRSDR